MTIFFRTRSRVLATWLVMIAVVATIVRVPSASAHVSVSPAIVPLNSYQTFTVDVPTEKTVPTITVRLEIPAGLRVARFQPKAGWTRTTEKDASGLIVAVTWTGGSIAPDEYEQFVFLARTPREPVALVFKAYQTYEGGEVVNWVGPEDDNFPASVVQVTDEAPTEDAEQLAPSIEEPAATVEATDVPSDATTVTSEQTAAPTEAQPTATQIPTVTIAALPTPVAPTAVPPAGGATTAGNSGSDLGLFVALAALVVALIAVALAVVGLSRRRGVS